MYKIRSFLDKLFYVKITYKCRKFAYIKTSGAIRWPSVYRRATLKWNNNNHQPTTGCNVRGYNILYNIITVYKYTRFKIYLEANNIVQNILTFRVHKSDKTSHYEIRYLIGLSKGHSVDNAHYICTKLYTVSSLSSII